MVNKCLRFVSFSNKPKTDDPEIINDYLAQGRNLAYVGMTRAKKQLLILCEQKASRFVKEMLAETPDRARQIQDQLRTATSTTQFKHGDWVFHKTFGLGMITVIDSSVITIAFNNAGIKRLGKEWCAENLQLF